MWSVETLQRRQPLSITSESGTGRGHHQASSSSLVSVPRCQVDGCHVALTDAKTYYRHHRVCVAHSKATEVVVFGKEQRFCQQCSRFHVLSEFDYQKRSCRRRLDGHNEGRRKSVDLTINLSQVTSIVKHKDINSLQRIGGLEKVAEALETDPEKGIPGNVDDLNCRKKAFGPNEYKKLPTRGFFFFAFQASKDRIILFLLVCGLLSLTFGIKDHGLTKGCYDGGIIFITISLAVVVSAASDFHQSRQLLMLFDKSSKINIEAIRDGKHSKISIVDVVVGDVVCLKPGDHVPADGLFLGGELLQVDESNTTGECRHVIVDRDCYPFLLSGAKVMDGSGNMLVTSVGMNTPWGKRMSSICPDFDEQTPLQAQLVKLTSLIRKVDMGIALLILIHCVVSAWNEKGCQEFDGIANTEEVMKSIGSIFAAAITIVIVGIPQGWPLFVTLTLAYSMETMCDCAMFRKLSSLETMGSTTVICINKTGMLTSNEMEVTKFWVGEEDLTDISEMCTKIHELLRQAVGLNTTGYVYKYKTNSTSHPQFAGSPTERAILSWAVLKLGIDMEGLKQIYSVAIVEAFNSDKKRSGVVVRKSERNSSIHVHWKGAAEMILAMCSHYYEKDGTLKTIDWQTRTRFEETIEGMAAHPLRCIAFAQKYSRTEYAIEEDGLALLALVGIKNPCRPGVGKAVQACREAGVNVKMITGENLFTAKAIATECGILHDDQDIPGVVVEGQEFRNYSADQRLEMVGRICVMARSSPSDKLLMVECLKQTGYVVAVTGHDANYAPALKEADVGLSMIQGRDADIVILDDGFNSVVNVLRWGRCVYNNIQKFLQFQVTVNVVTLVMNCIKAISTNKISITAVQLLWENLIIDKLVTLALATEGPTKELMKKRPVDRSKPFITNVMWRNLISQALYQIVVLVTLQFKGTSIFNVNRSVNSTIEFNTFVLFQVFNQFNVRRLEKGNVFEGIHKNHLFLMVVGMIIALQVLMIEFLKRLAGTERLDWRQWAACVGMAAMSWPIAWAVKCIPVSGGSVVLMMIKKMIQVYNIV